MTKISNKVFNYLIKKEYNRRKGEISSKIGKDYEDKASFFILTRFNKLLLLKSKISVISFNGLEDLDIFDSMERLFSFQIKTRKHTWTKRDHELLSFLENCINRFNLIKNLNIEQNHYQLFQRSIDIICSKDKLIMELKIRELSKKIKFLRKNGMN